MSNNTFEIVASPILTEQAGEQSIDPCNNVDNSVPFLQDITPEASCKNHAKNPMMQSKDMLMDENQENNKKGNLAVKSTNIVWDHGLVNAQDRQANFIQKVKSIFISSFFLTDCMQGVTLWFTGLSGSGKSTLAAALEQKLMQEHRLFVYRLDGDNLRHGLNKDLGFTVQDRTENIRRMAEVSKLFTHANCITLTSCISPFREDRALAKQIHQEMNLPFVEVKNLL